MSKIDLYKGDFIIANGEDEWWIAVWSGDPGRTLKIENAKRYRTAIGASRAIAYFTKRHSHRKMTLRIDSYTIAKKRIEDTVVEKGLFDE